MTTTQSPYCWHCGGLLKGLNMVVTDPIGNEHRVHKAGADEANEEVGQSTAQCLGKAPHIYDIKNSDES